MPQDDEIEVEFMGDGSIKINASKAAGTESEIIKKLSSLAKDMGGSFKIERHHPGVVHKTNAGQVLKVKGK